MLARDSDSLASGRLRPLPDSVRIELVRMGYTLEFSRLTSGPINAILFDRKHRTMWGGSSNHGEDYGIAW